MKKSIVRTIFLCSFFSIGILSVTISAEQGQNAKDSKKASAQGTSVVFREVEPVLRKKSSVPPRLPRFLPFMDESYPIHAVIQSVTASGYSILLANALPCGGANWCLYGTVKGSTQPFSTEGKAGKAIPLVLQSSIKASFFDSECHTYCSQAYVEWRENGFYYSIGIKGPNSMENILIKVANSAVAFQRR